MLATIGGLPIGLFQPKNSGPDHALR